MPLQPSLVTMSLSSSLTQLHTRCVAKLLLTPRIICPKCVHLNIHIFACFCTIIHTQSYNWLYIPPMAFTSCQDWGSNQLPPDGRASTLTTQPIQFASALAIASCAWHSAISSQDSNLSAFHFVVFSPFSQCCRCLALALPFFPVLFSSFCWN